MSDTQPKLDFSDIIANEENRKRWREERELLLQQEKLKREERERLKQERIQRRKEREQKRKIKEEMEKQKLLLSQKYLEDKKEMENKIHAQQNTNPTLNTVQENNPVNPFSAMQTQNPFLNATNSIPHPSNTNYSFSSPTRDLNMSNSPYANSNMSHDFNQTQFSQGQRPNGYSNQFQAPYESNQVNEKVSKRKRQFEEEDEDFSQDEDISQPIRRNTKKFRIVEYEPEDEKKQITQFDPSLFVGNIRGGERSVSEGQFHNQSDKKEVGQNDKRWTETIYDLGKPVVTNALWGVSLLSAVVLRGYLTTALAQRKLTEGIPSPPNQVDSKDNSPSLHASSNNGVSSTSWLHNTTNTHSSNRGSGVVSMSFMK